MRFGAGASADALAQSCHQVVLQTGSKSRDPGCLHLMVLCKGDGNQQHSCHWRDRSHLDLDSNLKLKFFTMILLRLGGKPVEMERRVFKNPNSKNKLRCSGGGRRPEPGGGRGLCFALVVTERQADKIVAIYMHGVTKTAPGRNTD